MNRLHAIYVIGKRDFRNSFVSKGIYISLLFSFLLMYSMISLFADGLRNPGNFPGGSEILTMIFMISVVGVSFLYLATTSVTAIAKEKGYRTLEILFYGPVDEPSFIVGKFLGRLFTYVYFLILSLIFLFLLSLLMQFGLSLNLLKIATLSIFLLSCIISLAIFLSTLTSSTAGSIALLVGFFIILFVLQVMGAILGFIPDFDPNITLIKDAVIILINNTRYISPMEYLGMGWGSVSAGDGVRYLMSILYSGLYSVAFLALSVLLLGKKGVK